MPPDMEKNKSPWRAAFYGAESLDDEALKRFFGPGFFSLLRRFMKVMAACGIVVGGTFLAVFGDHIENYGGFILSVIAIYAVKMVDRGEPVKALRIFLWTLWGFFTIWMYLVMGVRTPMVMGYPLLITMTGWLSGIRTAYAMALATIMAAILAYFLEHWHFLDIRVIRAPSSYLMTLIVISILGAVFSAFLIDGFQHQLRRVYELSEALQAKLKDLQKTREEVSQLNADLELRVEERTKELESALLTLKETQGELIQNEKMAALGSLVAGVSHELNTPIGNALTAASAFRHEMETILQEMKEGTLRKSRLEDFLMLANEGSEIVERSCQRASSLINSFKQIAVDQTSERRREYRLNQLVDDVVSSFGPTIKNRGITITKKLPEEIVCDGFPGPLSQILMNLLQNAVIHGFDGRDSGGIVVSGVLLPGDRIRMEVQDDGVGMNVSTLANIFDPFFTTKLGRGGSGLGLSISHRIMTEILRGTLTVRSRPGEGSVFTLEFPRVTPERI